jgi:predicted ATP-grasp superfamily ATP-dependent carboligase
MGAHGKSDVLLVNFSRWLGVARLPRMLDRAGCRVHVFTRRNTYVVHSGYCHRLILAPDDLPGFMAELKQFVTAEGSRFKWIIIADDAVLLELSRRLHESWVPACLPVYPNAENLDLLLDKAAFPNLVMRHGLPAPIARTVAGPDEALAAAELCGYPMITKSVNGFGGSHVARIANADELRSDAIRRKGPFVVQQFVLGQMCSSTALFDHGELRFWAAYERKKTYPGPYGPSAIIHFIDLPKLGDILQKLGRLTCFHGLCGVDFIYQQETGAITLLEQNGRPTPQAVLYLGKRRGAIEDAIRKMLDNDEVVSASVPPAIRTQGSLAMFPQDVCRSILERDYAGLLRWFITPGRWRELPWGEPALMIRHAGLIVRVALGR